MQVPLDSLIFHITLACSTSICIFVYLPLEPGVFFINSHSSVNLDTLLDKEATILSVVALITLSQDEIAWLTDVQQFLVRYMYPTLITPTTTFQEILNYSGMTLVWLTDYTYMADTGIIAGARDIRGTEELFVF